MQILKQPHKLTAKAIKHKKNTADISLFHVKVFSFFYLQLLFFVLYYNNYIIF